ncbi:MAG: thioredoxin family protein [Casimicrobiaceae bacterium]|nr:thioredoxin family protein [Casimicrobiaceae bacterium]MDW8312698.1 thioredoxin family protein [Burkholderiales bacterium]
MKGLCHTALGAIVSGLALLSAVTTASWAQSVSASGRELEQILPTAQNLSADAREARLSGKPILLFFSLTGCPYCRGALREALVPMYRDPKWGSRLLFRQIVIDRNTPLIDFDGKRVRPLDVAERLGGRFAPTVVIVDPAGQPLGEPLVGLASVDFYSTYVEQLAKAAVDELARRGRR